MKRKTLWAVEARMRDGGTWSALSVEPTRELALSFISDRKKNTVWIDHRIVPFDRRESKCQP